MAWRFKASKFKNTAPKIPRKEEWIQGVPASRLMQSCGNHIKASTVYMVFSTDTQGGSSLAVLPLASSGRHKEDLPMIRAHSDYVTDFDFSPFDDYLLASGSHDGLVKIWSLPDSIEEIASMTESVTLSMSAKRIESLLWNPAAEGVLAISAGQSVFVYDVERSEQVYELTGHEDQIQGITWRRNGSLLATTCKDKVIRVYDPRAYDLVQQGEGHQNVKDSRVQWIGDKDLLLSVGFNERRERQMLLWDTRNMGSYLKSEIVDNATGVLMPFFDPDTGMLVLVGKADNSIKFYEITDSDPFFTGNASDRTEQVKGAACVPKRGLNIMAGEVMRLLLLTKDSVIPVPLIVPRKSYLDFHEDIFPPTYSSEPAMTVQDWISGENKPMSLVSLDPAKLPKTAVHRRTPFIKVPSPVPIQDTIIKQDVDSSPQIVQDVPCQNGSELYENGGESHEADTRITEPPVADVHIEVSSVQDDTPVTTMTTLDEVALPVTPVQPATPKSLSANQLIKAFDATPNPSANQVMSDTPSANQMMSDTPQPNQRNPVINVEGHDVEMRSTEPKKKVFAGVRQSKFRHLKGTTLHKSTHLENVRNLSRTLPGESDLFHANKQRCAVPLTGAGGVLAILEFSKPGKLLDVGNPNIQNGSKVTDFVWDPFDDNRLVVGSEDARIRIFQLPEEGLEGTLSTPLFSLAGHTEKVYFVRFHPLSRDVLASASYDMSVRIWDLADGTEKIRLTGHQEQIFCLAWSPDGQRCATVCKNKIRVYDPRLATEPTMDGVGPAGSRGARVAWVLNGDYLVISGFDKSCQRQLYLYDMADLSKHVTRVDIDNSTAILIIHYDEDSSTIFLTGRGDSAVFAYEVSREPPYLFPLSSHKCHNPHQALSFLPKNECQVRDVEFAKAWRLTANTVEPVSFTVPRVKKEFFQDDVFPETDILWEPSMSSSEWFAGENRLPKKVSLMPEGMSLLSEATGTPVMKKKFDSFNKDTFKTDEQKKEELLSSMTNKMSQNEEPLPQDLTEGVDDEEWDD